MGTPMKCGCLKPSLTLIGTSSSIHGMNGIVVYSGSSGQKVVGLSSAGSKLRALVSGACDGICVKHVLEFLTGDVVHRCQLCHQADRRGSGKMLWQVAPWR